MDDQQQETTVREPQVTVRYKHTVTKDGWRLDESSLTVSCPISTYLALDTATLFQKQYQEGRDEAERRNQE